jgi:hypothetical protein
MHLKDAPIVVRSTAWSHLTLREPSWGHTRPPEKTTVASKGCELLEADILKLASERPRDFLSFL